MDTRNLPSEFLAIITPSLNKSDLNGCSLIFESITTFNNDDGATATWIFRRKVFMSLLIARRDIEPWYKSDAGFPNIYFAPTQQQQQKKKDVWYVIYIIVRVHGFEHVKLNQIEIELIYK